MAKWLENNAITSEAIREICAVDEEAKRIPKRLAETILIDKRAEKRWKFRLAARPTAGPSRTWKPVTSYKQTATTKVLA